MSSASPAPGLSSRAQLRWRSISWALVAGLSALAVAALWSWLAGSASTSSAVETCLRSGGCGLFYGLLAFHLQRVDPDDSHLQAGLVGAVCGIHSLGLPPLSPWPLPAPVGTALAQVAPTVMMELVRAWLPLIGAALVLHGSQALSRVFAARPQAVRRP